MILIAISFKLNTLSDEDYEEETHAHPHGSPLNIMHLSENQTVEVDWDSIDKTFLHPEVINRKIVVISIIGAFRKGKSFLMDYCLRYMYGNVSMSADKNIALTQNMKIFFVVQISEFHEQSTGKYA